MEGRKESKYNLTGICPECGKLIKVEHIISVDLVDTGTTTKLEEKDDVAGSEIQSKQTNTVNSKEGKDNGEKDTRRDSPNKQPESDDIRPDSDKGSNAATGTANDTADSGKSAGTKKTGGKTK